MGIELTVTLESEDYGYEEFGTFTKEKDAIAVVKRLIKGAKESFPIDGVVRTVGIKVGGFRI